MAMRWVALSIALGASLFASIVRAEESLCAAVKIEIAQEVSLERQGFEALMRVTNTLDTFSLENVSVTVNFQDANGNAVVATSNTAASNAAFFIRLDGTRDLTGYSAGADGKVQGGSIAPKTVGEMRWLIIPTAAAAGQTKDGKLFYVGAQLKYSYGGKEEVVDVAPDSIVVKPQPALVLDYFLTKDVVGDDAFTPEVEPAEPYTLGVRIANGGYGYAKSVKIESAQPTITENKKGLSVGFKILGSTLKDQPATPSLLLNFGNIEPMGMSTGRWLMETSLSGTFTSFSASFTHVDELGGALTSLIKSTNANFLIHDVMVDVAGRDSLKDFLALSPEQELYVYESENTGTAGVNCTSCSKVTSVAATVGANTGLSQTFTHLPQAGFSWAQATDPYQGKRVIAKAIRQDGTLVHPSNLWLSKVRAADKIHFDYFINIFDANSLGAYTLYWGVETAEIPQAPVIQFIPDQITHEGGSVGFLVQATDPNGTIPDLRIAQLPAGAQFNLTAPNKGTFTWSPQVGQAGTYPLTFIATDGTLESNRPMVVQVNPAKDTDGDGLDDDWEMQNFGSLNHDGKADSDGDGRTDKEEFDEGTNPNLVDTLPAAPQVLLPIDNSNTLAGASAPLLPELVVKNGTHPKAVGATAIALEVYADDAMTQLVAKAQVDEGTGGVTGQTKVKLTTLHLEENANFNDNQLYFWRAKTVQKAGAAASSSWVKARFFINTQNDAPTAPHINAPVNNGTVTSLSPSLSVTNAFDLDRDLLNYSFTLADINNPSVPVASASDIPQGANGVTDWLVPVLLQEDHQYQWFVTVTDGHGGSAISETGKFTVNTENGAPTSPVVDQPLDGSIQKLTSLQDPVTLAVQNAQDPEGAALTYFFEVDSQNTFDTPDKKVSPAVVQGSSGKTSWSVNGFTENQKVYWRARAFDGHIYSNWVLASFTASKINENPTTPVIQNPANAAQVTSLQPLLEVNPAVDPEGKPLSYKFQIFTTAEFGAVPILETLAINPAWQLDVNLADKSVYYWRVRAEDPDGGVSPWTPLHSFSVLLPPVNQKPVLTFTSPSSYALGTTAFKVTWTDSDEDSDAKIDLYLLDNSNNKLSIVKSIEENTDGDGDSYTFYGDEYPLGHYTLAADIYDEKSVVTVKGAELDVVGYQSTLSSGWLFNEGTGTVTKTLDTLQTGKLLVSKSNSSTALAPTWVAGKYGNGLSFDGLGSYVELTKAVTDPLLGESTLAFWFKTARVGNVEPRSSAAVIGSKISEKDAAGFLQALGNDVNWGSMGLQGQIGFALGDSRLLGLKKINDSLWHHIVITRKVRNGANQGMVKVYVDGNLDAAGDVSDLRYNGLVNSFVGFGLNASRTSLNGAVAAFTGSGYFLSGSLDNINIYKGALTLQDVIDLYKSESGGLTPTGVSTYLTSFSSATYEAESAVLTDATVESYRTGFTGLGHVGILSSSAKIMFFIERPTTQNVELTIRYSTIDTTNKQIELVVEGGTTKSNVTIPVDFPGTNKAWMTKTVIVKLESGINKVAIKDGTRPNSVLYDKISIK